MRKIYWLIIIVCVQACGQTKQKENKNITERLAYLQKKIKTHKNQPLYQMSLSTNAHYKVLVNGLPVVSCYADDIGENFNVTVNYAILESGMQDIEIQVFPNEIDKEFSLGDYFGLKIVKKEWKEGSLETLENVFLFKSEKKDFEDKKIFIYKRKFKAEVPFNLKGWKNTEPFKLKDSLQLKQKLYKEYKKMGDNLHNGNYEYIQNIYLNAHAEFYESQYVTYEKYKEYQEELGLNNKTYTLGLLEKDIIGYEMLPLEDYKIAYYCNNRVVRLEIGNGRFKGESQFAFKRRGSLGRLQVSFINLFYMKGTDDKGLVIVR